MTHRRPGSFKPALHSMPWFHSGRVPAIKYSYSHSGLTPSNYPVRIRSIKPGSKQANLSRQFSNTDQISKPVLFRQFRQFMFLRDNEIILTIQHCDGCEQHQATTRHNPQKYSGLAQKLKISVIQRFPMIKVIIKPISQHLERGLTNTRIGAFEVQVCAKIGRRMIKEIIHSKLESLRWPVFEDLLRKISNLVPTHNLKITLVHPEADPTALKNITVRAKPKQSVKKVAVSRPVSAVNQRSVKKRPVSAAVARKVLKNHRNQETICFQEQTDRDGQVYFKNLPVDSYQIQIVQTKSFKGDTKFYSAFQQYISDGVGNIIIELKPKQVTYLKILILDQVDSQQIKSAIVRLLRPPNDKLFVPSTRSGVYELTVPKGQYQMIVQVQQYQQYFKVIKCTDTDQLVRVSLERRKARTISVHTCDMTTGEPLQFALLKLTVNDSFKPIQGASNTQGFFCYNLDDKGLYTIKAEKNFYLQTTKHMLVNHTQGFIYYLPLIPIPKNPGVFQVILTSPMLGDDLQLEVEVGQQLVNSRSPQFAGFKFYDFLKTKGMSAIQISDMCEMNVRIYIKILSGSLITGEASLLKNGVSAFIVYNNRQIISLLPGYGSGYFWDLGMFNPYLGSFTQTNVISINRPTSTQQYIKDFQNLTRMAQVPESLNQVFGFDSSGLQRRTQQGPDLFISPEIFRKIISSSVSEESLNYILQGVSSPEGVSLKSLTRRFQYARQFLVERPSKLRSVEAYAQILGMDLKVDSEFLWIAQQGLLASLPFEWEIIQDARGEMNYRHSKTGEVTFQHPNDKIYREKFLQCKAKKNPPIPSPSSSSSSLLSPIGQQQIRDNLESCLQGQAGYLQKETFDEKLEFDSKKIKENIGQLEVILKAGSGEINQEIKVKLLEQIECDLVNFSSLYDTVSFSGDQVKIKKVHDVLRNLKMRIRFVKNCFFRSSSNHEEL